MKKIEKRALLCLLLAAALLLGSGLFVFRFVKNGGRWVSVALRKASSPQEAIMAVPPLDTKGKVTPVRGRMSTAPNTLRQV